MTLPNHNTVNTAFKVEKMAPRGIFKMAAIAENNWIMIKKSQILRIRDVLAERPKPSWSGRGNKAVRRANADGIMLESLSGNVET